MFSDRWLTVAWLVTLAHFIWLASYVVSGYTGPDADGYFGQAGIMATHSRTTFDAESPAQYIGMHWLEKEDGTFISRYPPGLPLLLASTWITLGREAAFYVNPLLASATVFAVFWFVRRWAGPAPALAAAIVQALHAEANSHALGSTSHTATTFFLIAGLALLDRWGAGGSRWMAVTAGLSLGFVPAVRYAEAAAAIGILAFLAFQFQRPERRRGVLLVCAGASIPVAWMLLRNQLEFGAFWRTAYYLTGESNLRWAYFLDNWPSYLLGPLDSGVGIFYGLAILGLLAMIRDKAARPLGVCLALCVAAITLVYTFYYFNAGGPGRFLLPMLPLYLLAGCYFLQRTLDGRQLHIALALLVCAQALPGIPSSTERLDRQFEGSLRGALVVDALAKHVPDDSILFISERSANEQVHHAQRWRLADTTLLGAGQARMEPGRPGGFRGNSDRPSPMQQGKAASLRAAYEGLTGRKRARAALEDVREWAGDGAVYYVLAAEQADAQLRSLRGLAEYEHVARVEFPESSDPAPGRGRRQIGRPGGGPRVPGGFGGPGGMPPPMGFGGPGRGRRGGRGGVVAGPFGGGSGPLEIYRLTIRP